MPEIPELEAFKNYVDSHCLNKLITDVTAQDKKVIQEPSFPAFKKSLVDNKFMSTQRLGKYLIINLKKLDKKLVMHFGLTGSLFYTKNLTEKVPYTCVSFFFNDHSVLHWTCKRKFGKLWIVDSIDDIQSLEDLGPDALSMTKKQFLELLDASESQNIKAFLMDQSKIAGIGNEYSDEILFQAGIDPHHEVKDLNPTERNTLYQEMDKVLEYAIKVQIKNSKEASGPDFFSNADRESFKSSYLQAHRHIDMICPKNKNHTLKKATIAGRTSYYCPVDQK